ncbi:hypothetical protein [Solihabitans fulvus]|nr:hypothetical protein [Solihabitans fulvus]
MVVGRILPGSHNNDIHDVGLSAVGLKHVAGVLAGKRLTAGGVWRSDDVL